jgi:rRNA pseudouridine-1189 N-methylase Emg1 (Nep1/Mra1 family)
MLLKELSKSKISSNEDKMLMGVLKKFLKAIVNKNTQDLVIDPKVKNSIDSLSK